MTIFLGLMLVAFFLGLISFALVGALPAIPIILVAVIAGAFAVFYRRRFSDGKELREFRGQERMAGSGPDTDFTDRDRETLSNQ